MRSEAKQRIKTGGSAFGEKYHLSVWTDKTRKREAEHLAGYSSSFECTNIVKSQSGTKERIKRTKAIIFEQAV